ncbi:unnamed protein product [Gordionus sp. m RMFG-2023]
MSKKIHYHLANLYSIQETIGCGGFCKVKLATHILTGEKVAIKIIDKIVLKDDLKRAYDEIEALKELHHKHIIQLYQVIETENIMYMIMEYCTGGELFDYIISRERIPEDEARLYFRQILMALAYLHKKGYAHRDLKPENLLLDENNNLKLIDFGLCAQYQDKMALRLDTCCGSPAYAAPELIKGDPYIGSEVDVWSLGVLLYALLCGFLPFDDENLSNLYRKIMSGQFVKPDCLSHSSVSLLNKMLETNPARRINTKQLLTHPWVLKNSDFANPLSAKNDQNSSQHSNHLRDIDEDIIEEISTYFDKSPQDLTIEIKQTKYDYQTATYLLLLKRKREGKSYHLLSKNRHNFDKIPNYPFLTKRARVLNRIDNIGDFNSNKNNKSLNAHHNKVYDASFLEENLNNDFTKYINRNVDYLNSDNASKKSIESGFGSYSNNNDTEDEVKRKNSDKNKGLSSGVLSPSRSYDSSLNVQGLEQESPHIMYLRTKSLEDQLNTTGQEQTLTPEVTNKKSNHNDNDILPGGKNGEILVDTLLKTPQQQFKKKLSHESSSSHSNTYNKNLLGSIEKGIDKIRNILFSPAVSHKNSSSIIKRSGNNNNNDNISTGTPIQIGNDTTIGYNPRSVIVLNNVSTSGLTNFTHISTLLKEALVKKGIIVKQKGLKLQGRVLDESGKTCLTFELEIVYIPKYKMYGIRRKRLRGDSWHYKKICEEVLALTSEDNS